MPATERLKAALADRYYIEKELGAGGMATVYLARDVKHDREVALKVLRPDVSAAVGTERFLSEIRIAARLDHPNILTLIDSGEVDGLLYYVLPYVRGDSLRARLNRDRQLPLGDAVSITEQIARALDYAHAKGVIHRDIKPENILFHEGVAVLTDFGIALAVQEGGGNRLTATGISIGTPQYMSPEQATGDRSLDRRSDVYSLGTVFYEMVAGEPPITGASTQAIIAKLITERPIKLRVLRHAVSPAMEEAADRALAKVPADRFESAGAFALAVQAKGVGRKTLPSADRKKWIFGGAAAAVALAIIAALVAKGGASPSASGGRVVPGAPRQVTSSGVIRLPTISADGKMIAYAVDECTESPCTQSIDVEDTGGGVARRIAENLNAIWSVDLSPDRRNVMFTGRYGEAEGAFIVPTLGGTPRHITAGPVSFYAGGDSLIFTRSDDLSSSRWLLISGLDAIAIDSVLIDRRAGGIGGIRAVPGSEGIIYAVVNRPVVEMVMVDRSGRQTASMEVPGLVAGVSSDAAWLRTAERSGGIVSLIRVPFDATTGGFSQKNDTVYTGKLTGFGISSDGGTLVVDDGAYEYEAWALSVPDFIAGRFSDARRVTRGTRSLLMDVAPDAHAVAVGETSEGIAREGIEWSIVPLDGSPSVSLPGRHRGVKFYESTTLQLVDWVPKGVNLSLWDYRTKRRSSELAIADSMIRNAVRVRDQGWAWISDGKIVYRKDGEQQNRNFTAPAWCGRISAIDASPDGQNIAFTARNPKQDSILVGTLSIGDGRFSRRYATVGGGDAINQIDNGAMMLAVLDGPLSWNYTRIDRNGTSHVLGNSRRAHLRAAFSNDLEKAVVLTSQRRADAWMIKINRN